MKRVVYLIRQAEGGMIRHLVGLLTHLDRGKYEPYVIAPPENNLLESLDRLDVTLYQLEISDRPEPGKDIKTALRLRAVLRKARPDLLHVHGHKAAFVAVMARAFLKDKSPMVVSVHNYPSYHTSNLLIGKAGSLIMRLIARKSCMSIAVSDAVRRGLVEIDRIDPSRATTIHNGTEPGVGDGILGQSGTEAFRRDLGITSETVVVGTAGRLIKDKGHSILLPVAERLRADYPDIKVLIAGDGPERNRLENDIAAFRLKQSVLLMGFIDDLRPFFDLLDVFVLPSQKEAFGMVLLEAMRSGCPVVASDIGGIPEIVRDGETGLLFKAGDAQALADTIGRLLEDKKLRDRLKLNAQRMVKEEFSLERMTRETEKVYDACLTD